jgi:hypothetical protein
MKLAETESAKNTPRPFAHIQLVSMLSQLPF